MRFIDEVTIRVISGSGGKGCASFRREAFVPFGGPDGGDGGRGGNVVFVGDSGVNTLYQLRSRPFWRAEDGEPGRGSDCTGRSGPDLELPVPAGTRVFDDATGELLADVTEPGQRWVAAKGGQGGQGNTRFKTSTNRTPRQSTPGAAGEDRKLRLELLLMADVGLLGFPNAGKSTFISKVSAARPKIADYPFTTLTPNLGVVRVGDDGSFVVADIPGLIRGAAQGAGLGHQFLRHLQRNRILLHLVSLSEYDALEAEELDLKSRADEEQEEEDLSDYLSASDFPDEAEQPEADEEEHDEEEHDEEEEYDEEEYDEGEDLDEGDEVLDEQPPADEPLRTPADPVERYLMLRAELEAFDADLAALPEIVVLTKADLATPEQIAEVRAALDRVAADREILVISAATGKGVRELVDRIWTRLQAMLGA